jgi:transposase-like protein
MPRKGKYDKEIVEKICLLIQTDSYTIAEICQQVSINQDTYFDWLKKKTATLRHATGSSKYTGI